MMVGGERRHEWNRRDTESVEEEDPLLERRGAQDVSLGGQWGAFWVAHCLVFHCLVFRYEKIIDAYQVYDSLTCGTGRA